MASHIKTPTIIKAQGNLPKEIREYIGHVNSGTSETSIAYMNSPAGWDEPGQQPEFNEYTLVLKGCLHVETKSTTYHVKAGEAFIAEKGEWVRYSTPEKGGAEYVAVCIPGFTPETVNRDR